MVNLQKKEKVLEQIKKFVWAIPGLFVGGLEIMGYCPFVLAYFALCVGMEKQSVWIYMMTFWGMWTRVSVWTSLKYMLAMFVVDMFVRGYCWLNQKCQSTLVAGAAAGVVALMNISEGIWGGMEMYEILLGISEGAIVFGVVLLSRYVVEVLMHMWEQRRFREKKVILGRSTKVPLDNLEVVSTAMEGLSDTFRKISKEKKEKDGIRRDDFERELRGTVCISCSECATCYRKENLADQMHRLYEAVKKRVPRKEMIKEEYLESCCRYEDMVDMAVQAFGRMELNAAWHKRMLENRAVIANQLTAMANIMKDMTKTRRNVDRNSKVLLAKMQYEAEAKGIEIKEIHLFEDDKNRFVVKTMLVSKVDGGVPTKRFLDGVEKVLGVSMRTNKDARNLIGKEEQEMTLYEDTWFYVLSGIARRKKDGAPVSGDNFSIFDLDDGSHHVCISDGMGSGIEANKESELVVGLLENFIEAGFSSDMAIGLMNSAMVLKGEENHFSTFDYGCIDLYSGEVEIRKIGAPISFCKRDREVVFLGEETLPAGISYTQEAKCYTHTLEHGDFLVMLTDGVVECLQVAKPYEALSDMIAKETTQNAGLMAKNILDKVLMVSGGQARDDMTVLVTGIWEK